ncbi:hypothetical protein SLE2022_184220 [Rubroshorea leprosula]
MMSRVYRWTIPSAFTSRKKTQVIKLRNETIKSSNTKKANLSATRTERIKLPLYDDGVGGHTYHISEFLRQPSGIEAVLNTSALQSFQLLENNVYRCILPEIQFLNFEVTPVLDLRVMPTRENCVVELLSCKFEGSEVFERQNEHFSATVKNHIMWDTSITEPFLEVDVKLNISLEIYTRPFTYLPISAVEGPGNLVIQALVDRLVPLLLQQLLQDYENWVQKQCADL